MLSKQEHIDYWVKSAEDDWEAVNALLTSKKYVQCLFFAHLVLEKLCKSHWVKDNEGNTPPKTHNLVRLIRLTDFEINEDDLQFLEEFNDFQLEGRYPDYLFEIHKRCDLSYTQKLLERVKIIKSCLQEKK